MYVWDRLDQLNDNQKLKLKIKDKEISNEVSKGLNNKAVEASKNSKMVKTVKGRER